MQSSAVQVTPISPSGASFPYIEHSKLLDGECPDLSSGKFAAQQGVGYMNKSFSTSCPNQRKGKITIID
jgi:hypothetical protein